jgi:CRISPR/Cas system CSM-associated protein Csm4 (group 5 of RAMP superfamily)
MMYKFGYYKKLEQLEQSEFKTFKKIQKKSLVCLNQWLDQTRLMGYSQ